MISLYSNEMGIWEDLCDIDDARVESVREEAEAVIRNLKQLKPVFGSKKDDKSRGLVRKYAGSLRNVWRRYYKFEGTDNDYVISPWNAVRISLRNKIRKRIARIYYSRFDPDRKYIFFPLHLGYDSQITARAYQFWRQEFAVDNIARALPENYMLFVKEHPAAVGQTALGILKDIVRSNRNVRLIRPGTNSHRIIESADAVVVINSTVGWEALLYNKPVVVLGKPFYSGYGVTFDVENLFNLRENIREALDARMNAANTNDFLCRIYAASYKGGMIGSGYSADTAESIDLKIRRMRKAGKEGNDRP
jgi:hypothetical protein